MFQYSMGILNYRLNYQDNYSLSHDWYKIYYLTVEDLLNTELKISLLNIYKITNNICSLGHQVFTVKGRLLQFPTRLQGSKGNNHTCCSACSICPMFHFLLSHPHSSPCLRFYPYLKGCSVISQLFKVFYWCRDKGNR